MSRDFPSETTTQLGHGAAVSVDVGATDSNATDSNAVAQRLMRLKRVITENHHLVWRTLRRLGVLECDVEDATQQVFIVVGNKLDAIDCERERSFVFSVAMRVASDLRRTRRRHPEELFAQQREEVDPGPGPEAQLQREELLNLLGDLLKQLPEDLRATLILHEFEEMSVTEIARMLDIPNGTVASRLRRARLAFGRLVALSRESQELEVI